MFQGVGHYTQGTRRDIMILFLFFTSSSENSNSLWWQKKHHGHAPFLLHGLSVGLKTICLVILASQDLLPSR